MKHLIIRLWWETARRCSHMSLTYPSSEWYITCTILVTEAYSEPLQISKIELFSRIVHLFQPLSIFAKDSKIIVCLYRVGREWGFLLWPNAKCCYYFYKIIAAQMDGKARVLFPLRVVHLMCTRFLTECRVEKRTQRYSICLVKVRWEWRVRDGLCNARVAFQ